MLQISLVCPDVEFLHAEDMQKIPAELGTYPYLGIPLVATAIEQKNRGIRVPLNVLDKVRELLVDRAADLLPFRFQDQALNVLLRMKKQEVGILLCSVNTRSDWKLLCVNRLLQMDRRQKLQAVDKGVSSLLESIFNKLFQNTAGVICTGVSRHNS